LKYVPFELEKYSDPCVGSAPLAVCSRVSMVIELKLESIIVNPNCLLAVAGNKACANVTPSILTIKEVSSAFVTAIIINLSLIPKPATAPFVGIIS
jgi:hypothetical protein